MGPVIQSWISANPYMYFCTSVYYKTSEKKTPTDPDNYLKTKIYKQAC
jgi:hypothetical protein